MTNALVHFREGTRADRDAILELRARAFPADDAEKQQPDFWKWEFADGYAGPARLFVAESGDRLVGHLAFVPQRYAGEGRTVRGAVGLDAMTDPEHRRQGVFAGVAAFAAGRLRKDFQIVTMFQIRPQVLQGVLAAGWRAFSNMPVLLRPLSLRSIARDFGLPVGTSRAEQTETPIRALERSDFTQIDRFLRTAAVRQVRSPEFLQWRYRQNGHWPYAMHGVFEGDELRAYVIHRETRLRGLRSLAIADAGFLPGSEASLRQLLDDLCRTSRGQGIGIAAALLSHAHPAYPVLRGSRFFPGPHRFKLLLQVFDDSLERMYYEPWSLSWGDTDHL